MCGGGGGIGPLTNKKLNKMKRHIYVSNPVCMGSILLLIIILSEHLAPQSNCTHLHACRAWPAALLPP